ncbi:methylmalonyl-CoA mutase subunit beta [Nonlabens ulvanivorans]|uniref:Methylmalonyl-CoA mutase n=1 Tax=Nonlabens ulvanivorans TaxID=906888 RepID=A0A084JZX0_NONUL|nr:methylmalonyl-CoA mutase subunit beta [Nonlabens ulvanivorans]KEZ94504.1 methylmalonyl-CoA mutase [Nonlabens ulvanivorans]PRX13460.1 methylmalonyl-CoA mutase [Nonlabens ulvanivorans]
MSNRLFEGFEPVSETAWKQKIQMDLKGADYNETLVTKTNTGIDIKPIYHSDSAPQLNIPARATDNWFISQRIYAGNATAANKKAKDVLNRGSEGVLFVIPNKEIDPTVLLKGLPEYGIQIHPQFMDLDYIKQVHDINPKAYVHIDIINQLASDGNWFNDSKKDHYNYAEFIKSFSAYFSQFTVNTSLYQNAGATTTQELGYYAAHLNEYLNHYCDTSKEHDAGVYEAFAKAEKRINIDTSIGNNYFMEIAKYRAYRLITKAIGNLYSIDLKCYITASPSLRNKSLLDYNVNLLRTTTECMSAVLGGADTLYNLSYDAFFNKENEFGDRIARNQLRILKDEAYLEKINNAADGSYYIDTLTKQLTEKALDLFKMIENGGGFVQSLFDGTIQRKIKESAAQELSDLGNGKKILVGVNKYPNADLPLQKEYELYPFVKANPRKTLIAPIVPTRLAESIEKAQL